ncbi:hypothetical protein H6H02_09940 [Coleofasciculus sp. FACHB-1120]|nr:hypothetical protein [Coleofasciculus sp. FACHB-1120]
MTQRAALDYLGAWVQANSQAQDQTSGINWLTQPNIRTSKTAGSTLSQVIFKHP